MECALSYWLLRKALADEYGIHDDSEFQYSEHGKPSLAAYPHMFFNISHCKHAVACVVGSVPVGIDVESLGRYHDDVARYSMSDDEMQLIHSDSDADLAFTRLWTRKEALLKLTGEGVSNNMHHVLSTHPDIEIKTQVFTSFVCSIAVTK